MWTVKPWSVLNLYFLQWAPRGGSFGCRGSNMLFFNLFNAKLFPNEYMVPVARFFLKKYIITMFIWNHNSTQIEIGDKAGDVLDVFFLNQRLFLANVWLSKTKAEDVKTWVTPRWLCPFHIESCIIYQTSGIVASCLHSYSCLRKQEMWETVRLGQKMFGHQHIFLSVSKAQDTRFEMTR